MVSIPMAVPSRIGEQARAHISRRGKEGDYVTAASTSFTSDRQHIVYTG